MKYILWDEAPFIFAYDEKDRVLEVHTSGQVTGVFTMPNWYTTVVLPQ